MPKRKTKKPSRNVAVETLKRWASEGILVELHVVGAIQVVGTLKYLEVGPDGGPTIVFVSASREITVYFFLNLWNDITMKETSSPDEPVVYFLGAPTLGNFSLRRDALRHLAEDTIDAALQQLEMWVRAKTEITAIITTPLLESALRGTLKKYSELVFGIQESMNVQIHTFNLRKCMAASIEKDENMTSLRLGSITGQFGITIMDQNMSAEEAFKKYRQLSDMIQ